MYIGTTLRRTMLLTRCTIVDYYRRLQMYVFLLSGTSDATTWRRKKRLVQHIRDTSKPRQVLRRIGYTIGHFFPPALGRVEKIG